MSHMMSKYMVIIPSGNVWHQAITLTNDDLLSLCVIMVEWESVNNSSNSGGKNWKHFVDDFLCPSMWWSSMYFQLALFHQTDPDET